MDTLTATAGYSAQQNAHRNWQSCLAARGVTEDKASSSTYCWKQRMQATALNEAIPEALRTFLVPLTVVAIVGIGIGWFAARR